MSDDRSSGPSVRERLEKDNAVLAEWAACRAADSQSLIARFERMGYDLRGKSEDEIVEVLKRPPTRPPTP